MILLVGLGNPGIKYEKTRHNVGFMVLDSFLKKIASVDRSVFKKENKFNSLISEIDFKDTNLRSKNISDERLLLVKPLSFMNLSGQAVKKIMDFYKIQEMELFVVHDDVDLPIGKVKISVDRGSAGHRGVTSIIDILGSKNFVRIRVGVGKDERLSTDKFVLKPFEKLEESKVGKTVKKAVEALELIFKEGVEKASSYYNQ